MTALKPRRQVNPNVRDLLKGISKIYGKVARIRTSYGFIDPPNIMVNLGAFSFAAIGGISSYVLANHNLGIEKYAILFPHVFHWG